MKNKFKASILAVSAFLLFVAVFSCQKAEAPQPQPVPQYVTAPQQNAYGAAYVVKEPIAQQYDTLATSSSRDTADYYLGSFWSVPVNVGVQIIGDSISGSTGATCYLQSSYHASGDYWVDVPNATATIDGVKTRTQIVSQVLRGRLRCRCFTPSSTQNTRVRQIGFVTEDNP